jgi:hypothetical protein
MLQVEGRHLHGTHHHEHPIHMRKEDKHLHGMPKLVPQILIVAAAALVVDGVAPPRNLAGDGEIMADRGAEDLHQHGVNHLVVW